MLLFVQTQSAQIIFVNPLCAINGRVSFGNVNFWLDGEIKTK